MVYIFIEVTVNFGESKQLRLNYSLRMYTDEERILLGRIFLSAFSCFTLFSVAFKA